MRQLKYVVTLLPAAMATPVGAQALDGGYYHGHMDGWSTGLVGLGMMFLLWGGTAVLIFLAFRWITDQRNGPVTGPYDALEILRGRLARGEIDVDDYEARRRHLET